MAPRQASNVPPVGSTLPRTSVSTAALRAAEARAGTARFVRLHRRRRRSSRGAASSKRVLCRSWAPQIRLLHAACL